MGQLICNAQGIQGSTESVTPQFLVETTDIPDGDYEAFFATGLGSIPLIVSGGYADNTSAKASVHGSSSAWSTVRVV